MANLKPFFYGSSKFTQDILHYPYPHATEEQFVVTLKTVYQGKCTDRVRWPFGADEGYIFASNHNQNYGIVIYAEPKNSGSCSHIDNRPELVATYFWLVNKNFPTC